MKRTAVGQIFKPVILSGAKDPCISFPSSQHTCLALAFLLTSAVTAYAQLPAGTTDATEHAQQNTTSARLQAAEHELESGDTKSAQRDLQQLAADRPHDAQILYDLGFAAEANDDNTSARKAYADAIAAAPEMAEQRVALGLLDLRTGANIDEGTAQLRRAAAITSAPADIRARAYRALAVLDENSQPAAARGELASAIKLTAETPNDILLGGEMALAAEDFTDAEAAYRRALLHPEVNLAATLGLAQTLRKQDKNAEAADVLTTALAAHPDDPRLIAALASLDAATGKSKDAIGLIVTLREKDPRLAADPDLTRELAHLYALTGDTAHAEPLFKALLAQTPNDPELLDDYGGLLVAAQRYAEAEAALGKAVQLRAAFHDDKLWAASAGHLAFAASKSHHPQLCLQALAARATVVPNTPASLFLEATAHDTLHQYKDAERAYRAFIALAGTDATYSNESFEARHRLIALEHMK